MLRTSKELFWNAVLGQLPRALFVKWDVCVDRAHLAPRPDEGRVVVPIDYQHLRLPHLCNAVSEQDDEGLLQLCRRWRQRCCQLFWYGLCQKNAIATDAFILLVFVAPA